MALAAFLQVKMILSRTPCTVKKKGAKRRICFTSGLPYSRTASVFLSVGEKRINLPRKVAISDFRIIRRFVPPSMVLVGFIRALVGTVLLAAFVAVYQYKKRRQYNGDWKE